MSWIPCTLLAPKLLHTGLCLQPLILAHRNTCCQSFISKPSLRILSPLMWHAGPIPTHRPGSLLCVYPTFRKVNLQLTPPSSKVTSPVKPAWGLLPSTLSQQLAYLSLNDFFFLTSIYESILTTELWLLIYVSVSQKRQQTSHRQEACFIHCANVPGTWLFTEQQNTNNLFCSVARMRVFVHVCAQLCLTLCNPKDCSLPAYSVHGISQASILKWVAISSSRGSFWPRDGTHLLHYHW